MHSSLVLLCIVVSLFSFTNGEWFTLEINPQPTCSQPPYAAVISIGECIGVSDEYSPLSYSKAEITGSAEVTFYDCGSDSSCSSCNSTVYTTNQCTELNYDGWSYYYKASISDAFPTLAGKFSLEAFYSADGCKGTIQAANIDFTVEDCSYGINGGPCEYSSQTFCSVPSSLNPNAPTSPPSPPNNNNFNANAPFLLISMYSKSDCSDSVVSNYGAAQIGACWNLSGSSMHYGVDASGTVSEYFCEDDSCSEGCFSIPLTLGKCIPITNKRGMISRVADSSFKAVTYSLYSSFPASIAQGKTIAVTYPDSPCTGQPSPIITLIGQACGEMCYGTLRLFCSVKDLIAGLSPSL